MYRCQLCLQQIARVYNDDKYCAQCHWSQIITPITENFNMYNMGRYMRWGRLRENLKKCTKCEEVKPKTEEHFYKNGKTKYRGQCIPCYREHRR